MRKGVDYANMPRPDPAKLRAAGYDFACRYTVPTGFEGKPFTIAEARLLAAADVDCVSNWEHLAGDAKRSYPGGVADAKAALKAAAACGMPANRPIYFSVDWDAQASELPVIGDYFRGVASILGVSFTGVYGSFRAVKWLLDRGLVTYAWQTYAWSGGQWDSRAQLRQVHNGATLAGGNVDLDEAHADDFGQWRPDGGEDMALTTAQEAALNQLVTDLTWQFTSPPGREQVIGTHANRLERAVAAAEAARDAIQGLVQLQELDYDKLAAALLRQIASKA
jgi:hypothetical protein